MNEGMNEGMNVDGYLLILTRLTQKVVRGSYRVSPFPHLQQTNAAAGSDPAGGSGTIEAHPIESDHFHFPCNLHTFKKDVVCDFFLG